MSQENDSQDSANNNYIFEPEKNKIIDNLIPQTLKTQLLKSVLESNASEQGSRMTAMSQATDNAGELLKELKLTYNRTRQAAITKEILEIVCNPFNRDRPIKVISIGVMNFCRFNFICSLNLSSYFDHSFIKIGYPIQFHVCVS